MRSRRARGGVHHLELWVDDLDVAVREWGWLLERLGWALDSTWADGRSWRHGTVYLVVEAGPERVVGRHDSLESTSGWEVEVVSTCTCAGAA